MNRILLPIGTTLIVVAGVGGCGQNQLTREGLEVISHSNGVGSDNPQSTHYVIKSRDQIKLNIREYPEYDTTVAVTESGTIHLRLIGEIPAVGLTKAQLMKDVESKFSMYIRDKLTMSIAVSNKEIQNVTVIGAVVRQGVYPAPPNGSLLEAIALAGGAVSDADLRNVKIFQSGNLSKPVEIDLMVTLNVSGSVDPQLPYVGPGDTVYIPKMENIVREFSEFLRDALFSFSIVSLFR
jgi:protein involved in polysaccharide export with SLBB domain